MKYFYSFFVAVFVFFGAGHAFAMPMHFGQQSFSSVSAGEHLACPDCDFAKPSVLSCCGQVGASSAVFSGLRHESVGRGLAKAPIATAFLYRNEFLLQGFEKTNFAVYNPPNLRPVGTVLKLE